ncbi:N(4)-(Beta-N-acetylglucosaminyl)-L-asparaginase-like [Prorops nasuta]|uniref:N(4)-(Beta-N-acetylglucosaminyl)-L-asparaginase- like n=1 Tax=Prorops nasuta TaxID=863751 RepID=UPI0034CD53FB
MIETFKKSVFLLNIVFFISLKIVDSTNPLIVVTWDYKEATEKAWEEIQKSNQTAIDAIELACSICEENQCRGTVGFGGSPDENGETTLDAMIMDGVKMDVGAVGGLRNIKSAISVARKVLENTEHSLLGGSLATEFAQKFGFPSESLQTDHSKLVWENWKKKHCQRNFWKNVEPNPKTSCGPYHPINNYHQRFKTSEYQLRNKIPTIDENNHDTIGVIAMDVHGHIAAGTSTNGAIYKIPGRIGDSPIPGAGAYADQEVGAAAGTGDGDVMMRFLPSFLAVEEMRRGASPTDAAAVAIGRIAKHYPNFVGGVIALNKNGEFGAACNGILQFPYYIANTEGVRQRFAKCTHAFSVVKNEDL